MKKKALTALLALAAILPAAAQNTKERKLTKKEKKMIQARIDSTLYAEAEKAVNDTAFTLEANEVVFKSGDMARVEPNTNFVAVKNGNAIVQITMDIPVPGSNGMGGVTVSGLMSGYQTRKDKKGNIHIKMSVSGTAITAQAFITLWKGSNTATINVQPDFNSDKITLNGVILPTDKSDVVRGATL